VREQATVLIKQRTVAAGTALDVPEHEVGLQQRPGRRIFASVSGASLTLS